VSDRLAGKRVLITGAAQGVGAVLARRCAEQGARVVVADVQDTAGAATAAAIGGRYIHLDITDAQQWADAMTFTVDALGGIDGLVNNAAVLHMGPIETTAADDVRRVLEVNVLGTYLGVQAAIAPMRTVGGGSIVNIGSIDGMHGMNSIAVYSASKWGVRGLTRSAAIELGRHAIRVNTINPSLGSPEMFAPFSPRLDWERYQRTAPPPKLYKDGAPYDVTPSDTAKMALFLLSDDSGGCTGADYAVDSGFTAGLFCDGLPGF
jgi:3alpha(or 20beta)-hydroxysteroid dehydrogenase